MNTKPILYSTEMVQSILDNRKTQTRRTKGLEKFNQNPDWFRYDHLDQTEDPGTEYQHFFESLDVNGNPLEKYSMAKAPYKIGEILWVRESFNTSILNSKQGYIYRADFDDTGKLVVWKPSIHMPKAAARIFLKVKNIRAERLFNISESDAIAEGVDKKGEMYYDYFGEVPKVGRDFFYTNETAKISFMGLWCKINGVDSWRNNPWVWVIEFERVEKPLNF